MGILSGIPVAEDVEKQVTEFAVAAMFRGLKYMFFYKSLVEDFDTKIEELNNEKEKICRRVKEESNNGKIINEDVLKWMTDVEKIQKKDKELSPSFKCIQCLPIPNPVSRLRLGREAVKNFAIVTKFTASAKDLSDKDKEIAYHPQPSEDLPNTNTVFQDFQSRKNAYGELWEQLVSEDSLILGIYGMPGVGKTRMMEQIWKEAQGQEKKIFDKVTKALVGGVNFDVIKLQDQLASSLKCSLESKDDKKKRADQLKRSMMNSGKILIIFDDVWGEISLHDIIGTSFNVASSKSDPGRLDDGNSWKGCKILFTSRLESHCLINKCKHPVEITTLEVDEALDMFKNTLGADQIYSLPDDTLVQQVCEKCAGVPLIIHAVGKALKFKTPHSWRDALTQLENCKMESIEGIDLNVYACLKLSFNNVPKDAKKCLLLCSLLVADEFINIDQLSDIAAGSQLVHGGSIKVHAMVDTLRSASLLLEDEDAETFRLHDIIRDAARSIAVQDHAFFFEKCGRGLPGNSADYATGNILHLELEKDDFNFPPDLLCPDLHTLWLVATNRTGQKKPHRINIPKFPAGMFSNIKFLVLEGLYWQRQLHLQPLNKLETLTVIRCNIFDTNVTCFPGSLEALCIRGCVLPTNLNFAKLINLRKLKIHESNDLRIVPNTLSSLSRLEELHLEIPPGNVPRWTLVPRFSEISELTYLTSLTIHWSDFQPSQDTSIFGQLANFDIRVGVLAEEHVPCSAASTNRRIELLGKLQFESFQNLGFQNLVERAEEIILRNTDVNISTIWNSNREAFKGLSRLFIKDCDSIEYLARISLHEIQYCISQQQSSFSNLTYLRISDCRAMKYLFNNFVAERLVQLQVLWIVNCDRIEVIVMNEGNCDGNLINFSKLYKLVLLQLPNLKSFYGEKKDMHLSSTSIMDSLPSVQPQPLFDGTVAFPSLEELKISGLNDTVSDIWGKNYYYNDNVSSSFWKLVSLKVTMCSGLKNVFHHSPMASHLIMHLKKMNVSSCKMMREIIGAGEHKEITGDGKFCVIKFPELTKLKLVDLTNLSNLWCCKSGETNTYKFKFPALVKFTLEDLEINLEVIELSRDDSTSQLEHLSLSCNKEIQLPSAWQLPLYDLERLTLRHCFPDVLKSLCFFRRLQFLQVTELVCRTLFSLSVLTSLERLRVLNISNCSMLEEIVEDARGDEVSGMDRKVITLFNLEKVVLKDLPNLKSFFHGTNYELHMPALVSVAIGNCGLSTLFTCSVLHELKHLKALSVYCCHLLEGIAADKRGIETSDTNDKIITLPKLSAIEICDLPNLKSFTHGTNYELHMPALETVEVANCGFSSLFTCSVFQKLQKLKTITVNKCKLLEGIVAADERGTETSKNNAKTITLPQLFSIFIGNSPNLKSFSPTVSYALNMPKLHNFYLRGCPRAEYFTFLKTRTGQVKVYSDWHNGIEVHNLNNYIRNFSSAKYHPHIVSFFSFSWSCPWAC